MFLDIVKESFGFIFKHKSSIKLLQKDFGIFVGTFFWFLFLKYVFFEGSALHNLMPIWLYKISFYALVIITVVLIYVVSLRAVSKYTEEDNFMLFVIRIVINIFSYLISFAFIYNFVDIVYPGSFSGVENFLDYFYFSVVSFSTVGFGDIVPKTDIAKVFVMFEILSGYLFIIFFVGNFSGISSTLKDLKESEKEN